MNILKRRITRIIAFVLSCGLIFQSCYVLSDEYSEYSFENGEYYENEIVNNVFHKESDCQKLFAELWAVGTMYLRNLDKNGKFIGNKYFKESTENGLKTLGLMDDEGNIVIPEHDNLRYSVSWGDNKISNSEDIDSVDESMIIEQKNGVIANVPDFLDFNVRNTFYNTSNYGQTYYYFGGWLNCEAINVYDFDTTGLNSYYNNQGVQIFFKTDGSTPVPSYGNYNDGYDDEYDAPDVPYYPEITYTMDGNGFYTDDGKIVINSSFIEQRGSEMPLTIKIAPSDEWISEYMNAREIQLEASRKLNEALFSCIPNLVIAALLMLYVFIAGGYDLKKKRFSLCWVDKIWAEVLITVAGTVLALAEISLFEPDEIFYIDGTLREVLSEGKRIQLIFATVVTLTYAIVAETINSIIIRLKCHCFWKTTFVGMIFYKILNKLKKLKKAFITHEMLRNDIFVRRFILRSTAAIGLGILALLIGLSVGSAGFTLLAAMIIVAGFIYLSLCDYKDFTKLSEHISQMNDGDYSKHEVDEKSVIYGMTQKLNNVSDSIQNTVENQIKSERMKIELVTNVSHDLKTPLTSIISYINLLSAEELSPEARDYVTILEQKSERLRAIVADVFDLAKATSRTDITLEKLDLVVLTNQVIGDLADKISSTGKDIRTNITIDSAPIVGDGKKLYRVMQNLIDNALKYSLEGTRVYITLYREENNVIFNIKNTASYEMTFTPEEIMERFTRGDKARTTEGNGLGLSIAKSFTEACGGKFDVEVDGDNFIAYMEFNII